MPAAPLAGGGLVPVFRPRRGGARFPALPLALFSRGH